MDWHPLILSFQVASVTTMLCAVLGVGLAVVLTRPGLPFRNAIDALVTLPLVMPPTVLGYYLLVSFGRGSALGKAFESLTGVSLLFTFHACVLAATVGALPLVTKSARTALEGVDPRLVDAARTLGASPVRAFFTVRLPLAAPGIFAGLMLGFARALGDFGITVMIAGSIPGETRTAALAIYDSFERSDDVSMNWMVGVLTASAILIMWGVNHLTRGRVGI